MFILAAMITNDGTSNKYDKYNDLSSILTLFFRKTTSQISNMYDNNKEITQ